VFLNILRYMDIPEAMALLAPRPLVFIGQRPFKSSHAYAAASIAHALEHLQR
jgi:hypothetical protein